MSADLKGFLKSLAEDPDKLAQYKSDPDATMQDHGLSDEHQMMVKKGDKEELKKETGADDAEVQFWVV